MVFWRLSMCFTLKLHKRRLIPYLVYRESMLWCQEVDRIMVYICSIVSHFYAVSTALAFLRGWSVPPCKRLKCDALRLLLTRVRSTRRRRLSPQSPVHIRFPSLGGDVAIVNSIKCELAERKTKQTVDQDRLGCTAIKDMNFRMWFTEECSAIQIFCKGFA